MGCFVLASFFKHGADFLGCCFASIPQQAEVVEQVCAFFAERLFCGVCFFGICFFGICFFGFVLAAECGDQRFGGFFAEFLCEAFDALLQVLLRVGAIVDGGLRTLDDEVVEAVEGEGRGHNGILFGILFLRCF